MLSLKCKDDSSKKNVSFWHFQSPKRLKIDIRPFYAYVVYLLNWNEINLNKNSARTLLLLLLLLLFGLILLLWWSSVFIYYFYYTLRWNYIWDQGPALKNLIYALNSRGEKASNDVFLKCCIVAVRLGYSVFYGKGWYSMSPGLTSQICCAVHSAKNGEGVVFLGSESNNFLELFIYHNTMQVSVL